MFTGLIEATGRVERLDRHTNGAVLTLSVPFGAECCPGDSLSVNGVCLTVTAVGESGVEADISPETIRATTVGQWSPGDLVNLERPLRADGRIGGHFVLGHVDGIGRIAALRDDGDCRWVEVDVPETLAALLVPKGSVAIDGVSLSVAVLAGSRVSVQIVPFTSAHTSMRERRPGDDVNLEVDVLGKYVARLLSDPLGSDGAMWVQP